MRDTTQSVDGSTALHLRVLRDNSIDCDVVVDDARRERDAALDRVREAVARRDDAAHQLEQAIAEATQ